MRKNTMEGIMRKNTSTYLSVILVVLALSLSVGQAVYAGSKDLVAGQRNIYKDDSTESMRDVYIRREAESKEYRETMLSNSKESVKLLREIRDLLQRSNAKE